MSTLVTNEFFAQAGHGDDVATLLLEILGESLQFDGCETIRIVRDQDDPDHVAGVTQWTERRNFVPRVAYAAWLHQHVRGHADPAVRHPLLRHSVLRRRHRGTPEHSALAHDPANAALPDGGGIPCPEVTFLPLPGNAEQTSAIAAPPSHAVKNGGSPSFPQPLPR